jgi:hypothetical protein
VSWQELHNFIRNPARDSAYVRVALGQDNEWALLAQLVAGVHDRLAEANWQRGGGKGKRPRPIPRPGVDGKSERQFGDAAGHTAEEMKAELARMAGRAPMGQTAEPT